MARFQDMSAAKKQRVLDGAKDAFSRYGVRECKALMDQAKVKSGPIWDLLTARMGELTKTQPKTLQQVMDSHYGGRSDAVE